MKSYGNILRKLRESTGYAIVEAAHKLQKHGYEVTNTNISRWENGYNNPSLEQFVALCALYGVEDLYPVFFREDASGLGARLNNEGMDKLEAYHDILVSSGWFSSDSPSRPEAVGGIADGLPVETGAPDRSIGPASGPHAEYASALYHSGHANVQRRLFEDQSTRRVPLYTVGPSAGGKIPFTAPATYSEPLRAAVPRHSDAAVHVEGNAMEPVIRNGTTVFVSTEDAVENGDIGVIALNGTAYVKQLRETEDGTQWLVAANPAYRPVRVEDGDRLDVLAKVIEPAVAPEVIDFSVDGAVPVAKQGQRKTAGREKKQREALK